MIRPLLLNACRLIIHVSSAQYTPIPVAGAPFGTLGEAAGDDVGLDVGDASGDWAITRPIVNIKAITKLPTPTKTFSIIFYHLLSFISFLRSNYMKAILGIG